MEVSSDGGALPACRRVSIAVWSSGALQSRWRSVAGI